MKKDRKDVPVLLKHYLKLNGKLLSFSIEEAFSGVVDALLTVDPRNAETRLLKRLIKYIRSDTDTHPIFISQTERRALKGYRQIGAGMS